MGANLPTFCVTAILTVAVTLFAQAPDPAASQPTEQVPHWLAKLADDDPAVRQTARANLMKLKREDLDTLRGVVEKNQPLAPAQSAALRDIVIHIFLSEEPYERNLGIGFLGVSLTDVIQPLAEPADERAELREAVLVTGTLPGFCGHRYLQTGDVVLGVIARDVVSTPEHEVLRNRIKQTQPGETVTLRLLRQGKPMSVTFEVDCQPVVAEQPRPIVEEFSNERISKGDAYWKATFAPIVTKLSSSI